VSDKLDAALSRIAALEAELRSRPAAPAGISARAINEDPIGTLSKSGVDIQHLARVFVAHTLGDSAPPELRSLAMMGPQVSATRQLSDDVQAMRQRLDDYESREKQSAARKSFSALATDKSKYPALAAAFAKSPAVFDGDVDSHKGEAAALAESLESKLKALGLAPPASTESAETAQPQSSQGKQAQPAGAVDTTPPPLPQNQSGALTQETAAQLKERILRKYSA
jgi:hypothetical protein